MFEETWPVERLLENAAEGLLTELSWRNFALPHTYGFFPAVVNGLHIRARKQMS